MLTDRSPQYLRDRSAAIIATCGRISPVMNQVHGISLPVEFWTRALAPCIFNAHNQQSVSVKPSEQRVFPLEPFRGRKAPTKREARKARLISHLRSFRAGISLRTVAEHLPETENVAFGQRARSISAELSAEPLRFKWPPVRIPKNQTLRQLLDRKTANLSSDFDGFACSALPQMYVESFPFLLDWLKKTERLRIKRIYVEHYDSHLENLFAAYHSTVGNAEIFQLQTGGFVGETEISFLPDKKSQYDYLLTYGWRQHPVDIPFYAVRLEEFQRNFLSVAHYNKDCDLLFMCGASQNSSVVEEHYASCVKAIKQSLDRNKFKQIKVRPRAQSRKMRRVRYPTAFQGLGRDEIENGFAPSFKACARSRLVVQLSMPSTNFLECVFVDQPVVGINTNSMPTKEFESHLQFLLDIGVLHKSVESMISFLNTTDLDRWWETVINNEQYKKFKYCFARSKAQFMETTLGPWLSTASV